MKGTPHLEMIHATAIAIDGNGILFLGPSGSGKSDLALRLIDRGAMLVSDDVVIVTADNHGPHLQTAPNIDGMIEVRGVGICRVPATTNAPLRLLIDLDGPVERLPPDNQSIQILGFDVPARHIAAFEASAPVKVELAMRSVIDADRWPVAVSSTDSPKSASI